METLKRARFLGLWLRAFRSGGCRDSGLGTESPSGSKVRGGLGPTDTGSGRRAQGQTPTSNKSQSPPKPQKTQWPFQPIPPPPPPSTQFRTPRPPVFGLRGFRRSRRFGGFAAARGLGARLRRNLRWPSCLLSSSTGVWACWMFFLAGEGVWLRALLGPQDSDPENPKPLTREQAACPSVPSCFRQFEGTFGKAYAVNNPNCPEPSALNPNVKQPKPLLKPLNPKPQTLNPKPQTLNRLFVVQRRNRFSTSCAPQFGRLRSMGLVYRALGGPRLCSGVTLAFRV